MSRKLPGGPSADESSQFILRASNVGRTFVMGDSRLRVLSEVDLRVAEGEFIAIEGRSGSGKSTLLHLLGALDVPDQGSIFYRGDDLATMSAAQRSRLRNRQFGFVFQFYHLLPELNVLENTLLGPMIEHSVFSWSKRRAELRLRARELLDQLGLGKRLRHKSSQLSGGERQRVAIARALMNRPQVLFADEPTGNLDAQTGRQIMDLLEQIHRDQKQTVLMVTHDRTLAREADRILVLTEGKLSKVDAA